LLGEKNPGFGIPGSLQRIVIASEFTQTIGARKLQMVSNRFGTSNRLSKEQGPGPAERQTYSQEVCQGAKKSQHEIIRFSNSRSQRGATRLHRGRMRAKTQEWGWWFVTGGKTERRQKTPYDPRSEAPPHQFEETGDDAAGRARRSGGVRRADSVALLLLLLELRGKLGIVPSVVHFNHKLRAKLPMRTKHLSRNWPLSMGWEFHSASVDVQRKRKMERANLEDAARRARYDYFRSLAGIGSFAGESWWRTLPTTRRNRGSRISSRNRPRGAWRNHPVAGPVVRPLLNVRRSELRRYLRARKQTWREDATNRDMKRCEERRILGEAPAPLEKQFSRNR